MPAGPLTPRGRQDVESVRKLLGTAYGADEGSQRELGGHIVRVFLKRDSACVGEEGWRGGATRGAPSVLTVPGLEEALEEALEELPARGNGAGYCVLTAPKVYHVHQEARMFEDCVGEAVVAKPGERAHGAAACSALKKVRDEWVRLAVEGSGVVRSLGQLFENQALAGPFGGRGHSRSSASSAHLVAGGLTASFQTFTRKPSVVTWLIPRLRAADGRIRGEGLRSTVMKLFDVVVQVVGLVEHPADDTPPPQPGTSPPRPPPPLPTGPAAGTASLRARRLTGALGCAPAEWEVAKQLGALLDVSISSGGKPLSLEGVSYVERAMRRGCDAIPNQEWELWLRRIEDAYKLANARPKDPSKAHSIAVVRLLPGRGGGRQRREEAVRELEERLLLARSHTGRFGRGLDLDTSKQEGDQEEYLHDSENRRMHWIHTGLRLGRGSFGDVFRVQFWLTMQFAAVKSIDLDRGSDRIANKIAKVQKEMGIMQKLDHKNILQFIGSERQGNLFHLFMEYCPEGTLRSVIEAWKENSESPPVHSVVHEEAVKMYTRQMASGLSHMHSRGFVHLDVKSINILVADAGMTIKLIDFGEAAEKPEAGWKAIYAERRNGPSGTPGHIAPEVYRTYKQKGNGYFGPPADIWSMACVVFEMIHGTQPEQYIAQKIPGDGIVRMLQSAKRACESPQDLAMPFAELPESVCPLEVKGVLQRCFETDQELRITADELLATKYLRPPERKSWKRSAARDTGIPEVV